MLNNDNYNNMSITVIKYTSGNVYEGNIQDNKKHGNGKMIYADGRIYEGKFEDDSIKNDAIIPGKMTYNDKYEYIGEFNKKGNFHGIGTYTDEFGSYTGEWKNGVRNGIGKLFDKEGKLIYHGEWENNKKKSLAYRVNKKLSIFYQTLKNIMKKVEKKKSVNKPYNWDDFDTNFYNRYW